MEPIQVVVDTNVLVAAVRSSKGASYALMDKLNHPGWQMNVSTAMILEYEANLKRQLLQLGLALSIADDILKGIAMVANRRCIFFRWRPMLPDPKDDFVLELAVAAGARFIITYNRRHFIGVKDFGIQTILPGDFLGILRKSA